MAAERFGHYWPDAETEVIEEGAEPDDFWDDLNGEGQYDRSLSEKVAPILEPRLFHCHLVRNRIKVEEVNHFEQADLDMDDVMLIDAGDEIYMWVGSGATAKENNHILDMAKVSGNLKTFPCKFSILIFLIPVRNILNRNPLIVPSTLSVLFASPRITSHVSSSVCSPAGKMVSGRLVIENSNHCSY